MQHIIDRFVKYITVDTQSDPNNPAFPSTEKQWDLAKILVEELKEIYYNTYGVWNWVTKTENTSLRKHQKDGKFKSPEKSYKDCGVKLIQFK